MNLKTATVRKDSEDNQFTLLCEYGEILKTKTVIIPNEHKNEFFLCKVLEPYPTFEAYSEGDDFDEGDIIAPYPTWESAKQAQLKLK